MPTAEATFNASHTYSSSPEASRKRLIDVQIMGKDFARAHMIDIHNETYLRELISFASKGTVVVKSKSNAVEFYIIQGGGEGFLPASYAGIDASRVMTGGGVTTSGKLGTQMIFDDNDLLVAFDKLGNLINSARLRRPISIKNPNIWTEHTANKVYEGWDNRPVSLYENRNFDVRYFGLRIDDKYGMYSSGAVRIDIHKQEATNGCIFIVDKDTPPYVDNDAAKTKLSMFEPQFIQDIQKQVGAKHKSNIGTMHMVKI